MMRDVVARRIAQGIVVLCAIRCGLLVARHDWQDAVLVGLVGAWALVTARKMSWRLRRDRDEPEIVATEIVNPLVLCDGLAALPVGRRLKEVS